MAEPIPSGSDVTSGTYKCTECGNEIQMSSSKSIPPCPNCGNGSWETVSGGDAASDPQSA